MEDGEYVKIPNNPQYYSSCQFNGISFLIIKLIKNEFSNRLYLFVLYVLNFYSRLYILKLYLAKKKWVNGLKTAT